jgi:non-canonical poly(A) RNA polymerase PAPD5/7
MPLDRLSSPHPDPNDKIDTSRKHREDGERATLDAAASPSNAGATKLKRRSKGKGSGPAAHDPPRNQESPVVLEEPSFENNSDFIAFRLEDDPEVHDRLHKESKEELRERDWDKGKETALERDSVGGRKRKADLDRNDGYSNKKERMDAASRKAPWVTDVDWEGSANVAELSAFYFYCLC